jgi:hypothetical protein
MDAKKPNAYRMRPESAVYAVFSLCFVALGVFGALELSTSDFLPFGLLRLAGAWAIAAFLGLRMARLGVYVEENGIRVRNPFRTRRVPWNRVRGFVLRRSLLGEFGVAELHDGSRLRLWGIQPRSRVAAPRDRRAELAVVSLNRELQFARGHGAMLGERGERTAQMPRTAAASNEPALNEARAEES